MDNQLYDMIKREFDGINTRLDSHFEKDEEAWERLRSHDEDIHFVKRLLAGALGIVTLVASYLGLKH